jgi:hypothetical protein
MAVMASNKVTILNFTSSSTLVALNGKSLITFHLDLESRHFGFGFATSGRRFKCLCCFEPVIIIYRRFLSTLGVLPSFGDCCISHLR